MLTGTGKTLAAVLPWLYRRVGHPDADVRKMTPRWLVIVLPQRAMVEQTVEVIDSWRGKGLAKVTEIPAMSGS